jgi:hypothetical protein
MNTEKLEKLKKSLDNKFIPDNMKDKIRVEIQKLESEIKTDDTITATEVKEEVKEIEKKVEKALEVADKKEEQAKAKAPRKPRQKKVKETETKKPKSNKKSVFSVAKEIRKAGESWEDAKKRASKMMKSENTETKTKVRTETSKLLASIRRKKELKNLSGTNIKSDINRTALPKGRRVSKKGWKNQYGESEGGRVYYENRDNRTDRLAPSYKDKIYLADGGTIIGTPETPLGRDLGISYTGLVGETGAMSSGEMFANGGGVGKKPTLKKGDVVEVVGRRWFDRVNGNTYHTAEVFVNDKFVAKSRMTYGYDEQYVQTAKELLLENYNLPKGMKETSPLWQLREYGVKLTQSVSDGLKRDLEVGGFMDGVYADGGSTGLPAGTEQHFVNYYLGEGTAQGIYAKGGGVRMVGGIEYPTGRAWTNEHRQIDKADSREVNYTRKKSFNDGGAMENIEYDDVLEVLKEKLEGAIDDLPMDYENSDSFTGEEVEKQSRDGFIAFTDGGYEVNWFEYMTMFNGSGKSLPTKPLDAEMDRQIDYNYQYAKERFIEEYPEIVEELGEDNIDYNSLYDADYGDEAEQLSEWEMDFDGDDTILCEIGAYYYDTENYRGIDEKHTIRLYGLVNLESPYHRRGNLDDSYDIDITFDSISELKEKVDAGLKEIIDWFDGKYYNDSTTEMKIRRMADGGFMDGVYAKGGEISIYNLRKGDKVKTRKGDIETIVRITGSGSYETIENEYTHSPESLEFVSRPSRKMAKGGAVSQFKNMMETNTITEKEINLIKLRMNNDKVDDFTQEAIDFIWDNSPQLTSDQNKKGIDYLRNLWKSPTGKERTNNPFGYREQDALETFEYFELRGFYDAGNRYRKFYVPLYTCVGAETSFEYYISGGGINIVG